MFDFWCFNCFILLLVTIDFLIVSRHSSVEISLKLTVFWIALGVLFSLYFAHREPKLIYEYLGAYFIEKSLSLDNIFVFLMIFSKFNVELKYQHKVLFLGIWGALLFRYLMIFTVGEIIDTFHFAIPIFGALLLYTGINSIRHSEKDADVFAEKFFERFSGYVETQHRGHFFVRSDGKWKATILIFVLLAVEISDVVFAFDSIPAIFSVTSDKTIIYSSNAFAIIGLRSLYGVFSVLIANMRYLRHAIGVILCGVGLKMILSDIIEITAAQSLIFILLVLGGAYFASSNRNEEVS